MLLPRQLMTFVLHSHRWRVL